MNHYDIADVELTIGGKPLDLRPSATLHRLRPFPPRVIATGTLEWAQGDRDRFIAALCKRGPSLHDLRGMLRAAKKRHRRAHRAMVAATVREQSPGRLVLSTPVAHARALDAALAELHRRRTQLADAQLDTFPDTASEKPGKP